MGDHKLLRPIRNKKEEKEEERPAYAVGGGNIRLVVPRICVLFPCKQEQKLEYFIICLLLPSPNACLSLASLALLPFFRPTSLALRTCYVYASISELDRAQVGFTDLYSGWGDSMYKMHQNYT